MAPLLAEIGLRLAKVAAATLVAAVVWFVLVGLLGVTGTVELALLAWLAGAACVLLVENSPI
jgi:hypothetical protein